jgi:predicted permease
MLLHDFRFAVRQLCKSPGFALAVILTLAFGIGVNTAVFSLVDGFMLRRLPYPEPERIAALVVHREGVNPESGGAVYEETDRFDGSSWALLKDNVTVASFASRGGTNGVNLKAGNDSGGAVRYVRDSRVSAHYFEVLGIPLYLGRSFIDTEDRPHGPPVVVLSYGLWQSTFHGNPALIGKSIELKGEPYTVVGILPQNAMVPGGADLFTPLQPATSGECGGQNCSILVRLKPGATWQQVDAQLSHVRLPYFSELESRYHGRARIYARPLQLELAGDMDRETSLLMLAVSFILLIACANLAGLTLVRISRRTQEIATRLALGATRSDILRQIWIENLVLAFSGAAMSLALAFAILRVWHGLLRPEMIPVGGLHLDLRVLVFTFGAALVCSLLFGALPALQTRRVDLHSSISSGGRVVSAGSSRLRQWLIGAEVGLTVVLLASAGLLIRMLIHLETLPPGFDPANVMTAKASFDDARYHDAAAFRGLMQKSIAAMRRIPGVEDAAVGLSVPYESMLNDVIHIADGKQTGTGIACSLAYVTPGYFSALRIPLLAGRAFTDSDTPTSSLVAIVNTSFGKRFYNDPLPVGHHFRDGDQVFTIVGVVADIQDQSNVERDAPLGTEPIWYIPSEQVQASLLAIAHIWFQPSWIVRTRGPIPGVTVAMQRALAKADPELPFSGFYSMQDILSEQLQTQRMQTLLLTALGLLALVLSTIGIGSLVSNLVVQRTREIGIRIALGSSIKQAMLHIGSSGLIAAGAGMIAGVAASVAALRLLSGQIYGVKTYDPVTLIAVLLVLATVAVMASFLPTLRISRIALADTLRSE